MNISNKAMLRIMLSQWAVMELEKGNRIKASRIQKVIDRHALKYGA